jgi:DNA-directed RNA polymerase-3 subunit RPC5
MTQNAHLQERAEKYRAIYSGGGKTDEPLDDQVSEALHGDPNDSDDSDDSDDPDDPVVAEYDVYVNNQVKGHLHLLQYVNRDSSQPYSEAGDASPLEVRFKPKAGLVEADIPLNVHSNFDREKGIHWGEAMRKSRLEKGGDSYGLAGGFGIGSTSGGRSSGVSTAAKAAGRSNGGEDISQEALLANFDDAINKGRVLDKQTLGGITNSKVSIQPSYYIGVFRNSMNPSSLAATPQQNKLITVASRSTAFEPS